MKYEKQALNTFGLWSQNCITVQFCAGISSADVLLAPQIKFMLIGKWDKHMCHLRYGVGDDIFNSAACSWKKMSADAAELNQTLANSYVTVNVHPGA